MGVIRYGTQDQSGAVTLPQLGDLVLIVDLGVGLSLLGLGCELLDLGVPLVEHCRL